GEPHRQPHQRVAHSQDPRVPDRQLLVMRLRGALARAVPPRASWRVGASLDRARAGRDRYGRAAAARAGGLRSSRLGRRAVSRAGRSGTRRARRGARGGGAYPPGGGGGPVMSGEAAAIESFLLERIAAGDMPGASWLVAGPDGVLSEGAV